jgi:hypothetical protein
MSVKEGKEFTLDNSNIYQLTHPSDRGGEKFNGKRRFNDGKQEDDDEFEDFIDYKSGVFDSAIIYYSDFISLELKGNIRSYSMI